MNPLSIESLVGYWGNPELGASIILIFNMLGALVLGALVGYERTFRSRAAGMRTLGLVCMSSAAFVAVCGYSHFWFGGHPASGTLDATRVVQGIITGIGFLGAGVILKDGTQISGLTTAAMIWVVAAVGVLIGVGLYLAAIVLAVSATAFTMWGSRFESKLPSQAAVIVTMKFNPGAAMAESELKAFFKECGYIVARNTVSIVGQADAMEWRFIAIGRSRRRALTIPALALRLESLAGVQNFNLAYARN